MTTNYSAQEITVLKDLEPVQIRPECTLTLLALII